MWVGVAWRFEVNRLSSNLDAIFGRNISAEMFQMSGWCSYLMFLTEVYSFLSQTHRIFTYVKIYWLTVEQIGSGFLPALGTTAAHWPYGKCQSRISFYCLQWLNVTHMVENSL